MLSSFFLPESRAVMI